MKIDCQLDYQTILRNQAQPVHVVVSTGAVPWRVSPSSTPVKRANW